MRGTDPGIDRRTVLKGTGVTLASSALLGTAGAQESSNDPGTESDRPEIEATETVADENGIEVEKMVIDGDVFFFRHNYGGNGQISYVKVPADSEFATEDISESKALSLTSPESGAVDASDVTTRAPVIEQTEGIKEQIGGCASWYSNHHYVGATIEFAEDIGTIGVSALAGLICTAISRRFGGKFGKDALNKLLDYVLGGGCSALAAVVVDQISGSELTIGFYDVDTGSLDWPEIALGVSGEYDDDASDLYTAATADGVHIEGKISL